MSDILQHLIRRLHNEETPTREAAGLWHEVGRSLATDHRFDSVQLQRYVSLVNTAAYLQAAFEAIPAGWHLSMVRGDAASLSVYLERGQDGARSVGGSGGKSTLARGLLIVALRAHVHEQEVDAELNRSSL